MSPIPLSLTSKHLVETHLEETSPMMLMGAVVSSLIIIKRRQMPEVIPSSWRKLWKEWELRALILLSLTTQIVLIILGNRRKYIAGTWIRVIVWSAYLAADSIAIMGLGVLSNDLGDIYDYGGILDKNKELTAFWAPFLLLHLGGTDSITAYSIEDNELWKRHSFGVISQAVGALYILLMAWTGSLISIIFILMFIVGFIKYLERVWVLYSASETKFKDSIPYTDTTDSKIMDKCRLKQLEGYHVTTHQVLQVEDSLEDLSALLSYEFDDADALVKGYDLLDMVKRVFADYSLSYADRDAIRSLFRGASMTSEKAFRIVEIELGFMYDLLYTKAPLIYSPRGIVQRIICICLTFTVLVVFSFSWAYNLTVTEKRHYSKVDLSITFLLLAVALLLELFSSSQLICSDRTTHWLIKHRKTLALHRVGGFLLRAISYLQRLCLFRRRRWSNSMGQFSLLSFSLREEKHLLLHGILKKLPFYEMLENRQYFTPVQVTNEFKEFIFEQVKMSFASNLPSNESSVNIYDPKAFFRRRGGLTLEKFNQTDLQWSTKLEFDRSILVWHLATEICLYSDEGYNDKRLENSKLISEYMVYLLVNHPNTLPILVGQVRFAEICADVRDIIEHTSIKEEACKKLIEEMNLEVGTRTRVLLDAQKVASILTGTIKEKERRWKMLMNIWMEMLCYAAYECRGRNHAKQLRLGELLTHVWLLMVNFQILGDRAIAELVIR